MRKNNKKYFISTREYNKIRQLIISTDSESKILGLSLLLNTKLVNHFKTAVVYHTYQYDNKRDSKQEIKFRLEEAILTTIANWRDKTPVNSTSINIIDFTHLILHWLSQYTKST